MKLRLFTLLVLLLFILCACKRVGEQANTIPKVLGWFMPVETTDTMHFELPIGEEEAAQVSADTIPNAEFFPMLDTAWRQAINHVADSSNAVVLSKGRFPLSDGFEACLVDFYQSWFRHQSLLLYDHQLQAFTGLVPVAEWYGGDGGQVLIGSWMLDYDGDGDKDLVRREIQHWLLVQGDAEPRDSFVQSASLWLWKDGSFVASPVTDTAGLVRRFPIRSAW